jgi:hypothetical protein
MQTRVIVLKEVEQPISHADKLCLQEVIYQYDDGGRDHGFRFIYRDLKTNNMKAQRGQANLLSIDMIRHMVNNFTSKYGAQMDLEARHA